MHHHNCSTSMSQDAEGLTDVYEQRDEPEASLEQQGRLPK